MCCVIRFTERAVPSEALICVVSHTLKNTMFTSGSDLRVTPGDTQGNLWDAGDPVLVSVCSPTYYTVAPEPPPPTQL